MHTWCTWSSSWSLYNPCSLEILHNLPCLSMCLHSLLWLEYAKEQAFTGWVFPFCCNFCSGSWPNYPWERRKVAANDIIRGHAFLGSWFTLHFQVCTSFWQFVFRVAEAFLLTIIVQLIVDVQFCHVMDKLLQDS